MNKNNERSSRAEQTAEWNLKPPHLAQPSHPLGWIAGLLLINLVIWSWGLSVLAIVGLVVSVWIGCSRLRCHRRYQRQLYIEHYQFADGLWQHVSPSLSAKQKRLIERGLKDFFLIYNMINQKIAMPSQAVDQLWHAFILDTQAYDAFCQQAFGKMLHHSPSDRMLEQGADEAPLFWVWQGACQLIQTDPKFMSRLPRLFAIDLWLSWPHAQTWDATVLATNYHTWYAKQASGHVGGGGGCSGGDSSDGGSGGCGGGCGGS